VSDPLSLMLNKLSIQAGVFYKGRICGLANYDEKETKLGHIHLLKSGRLKIRTDKGKLITLSHPSVVFFPSPTSHSMLAELSDEADVVCATVDYGMGVVNPLTATLPDVIYFELDDIGSAKPALEGLFTEAFSQPMPGATQILNRFMEVFIIAVFRHLLTTQQLEAGVLSGLAHPSLVKVLNAMHTEPEQKWTLQMLAQLAHQSRSKFADEFKTVVGMPALEYLTHWRISLSKALLQQGKSVAFVAGEVGYESTTSFTKAFKKVVLSTPSAWLKSN